MNRRQYLIAASGALSASSGAIALPVAASSAGDRAPRDVAIDKSTALIFSEQAPLLPAANRNDARAVWCRVPGKPTRSLLVFLHGHNGYVTVDETGRSCVPDWAIDDKTAREAASAKPAAPLAYRLDRLGTHELGNDPIVLVPEVSTLATGSFWAKEPAGQYADPARLGHLVNNCLDHLSQLRRPDGQPYLGKADKTLITDIQHQATANRPQRSGRIALVGHSGAGLPLEEAARSAILLPETGFPADLWLFDSTYWSKVAGFLHFCQRWHAAHRLNGGQPDSARFICIYRPKTATEKIADSLRGEIGRAIGVDPSSLVQDHTEDNLDSVIRPKLRGSGVLFLRTEVEHDDIPTVFIPELLRTSVV